MLRKLIKHEFRATGRTILPLFAIIIVLSFGVAVIVRTWDNVTNPVLNTLYIIVMTAYGIALAAGFIMVLVLMINRFRLNLLGDEGYVMFTLPVSIHKIVWSKIIVSCVWFTAATIIVVLSAFIVAFDAALLAELKMFWNEFWSLISVNYALNGTAILIEFLVLLFFGYAASCLQFYSAMALGYSFDRRKALLSVVFFFAFMFIMQIIYSIPLFGNFELFLDNLVVTHGTMGSIHAFFGISIACTAVYGAIFYFVTTKMLQKRLNLE